MPRMARYYFDVQDGKTFTPDEEGLELPGLKAAEDEAARTLPDIAKDSLPDGGHRDFAIIVRDEAGHPVLRLSLAFDVEHLDQAREAANCR